MDEFEWDLPVCHCGWVHYEGPCQCGECVGKDSPLRMPSPAELQTWLDENAEV